MGDEFRISVVRDLLAEHVKSPSLRHIRDPYALTRLAGDIVQKLERGAAAWRKWEAPREALLRRAMACWIPVEDMRAYLNQMPGAELTATDVAQRLRAFYEEPYEHYPDEELREGCLAIYEAEKTQGTELPAIVGRLREHVENEEERLRQEREARWRQQREEEKRALEQRFLSGGDCKWTTIHRSKDFYCRINGRAYRLSPTPDKKWRLFRIQSVEDTGAAIGTYGRRGDANKALADLAFKPEPRW